MCLISIDTFGATDGRTYARFGCTLIPKLVRILRRHDEQDERRIGAKVDVIVPLIQSYERQGTMVASLSLFGLNVCLVNAKTLELGLTELLPRVAQNSISVEDGTGNFFTTLNFATLLALGGFADSTKNHKNPHN